MTTLGRAERVSPDAQRLFRALIESVLEAGAPPEQEALAALEAVRIGLVSLPLVDNGLRETRGKPANTQSSADPGSQTFPFQGIIARSR